MGESLSRRNAERSSGERSSLMSTSLDQSVFARLTEKPQRSTTRLCRLRPGRQRICLYRLLYHPSHSADLDDVGLQRASTRRLHCRRRVATHQTEQTIDVAQSRPRLGTGEQTLRIEADGLAGLLGLPE